MTDLRLKPFLVLAAVLVATVAAGCTTTGNTGNSGSVRGGAGSGWENFRAEAPTGASVGRSS